MISKYGWSTFYIAGCWITKSTQVPNVRAYMAHRTPRRPYWLYQRKKKLQEFKRTYKDKI